MNRAAEHVQPTVAALRRAHRRRRAEGSLRARAVVPLVGLLALVVLGASNAAADTNTDTGLPQTTNNVHVQNVTYENPHLPKALSQGADPSDNDSETATSIIMPTGGRWYLECPVLNPLAAENDTGKNGLINYPWLKLNMDRDRCGSDGSGHYLTTSSWTTSGYSQVVISPTDARCGAEVASRTDAFSSEVVGPVTCANSVQMYPTLDRGQQDLMAAYLAASLGTCDGPASKDLASIPDSSGDTYGCSSKDVAARPIQYWPVLTGSQGPTDGTHTPYVYLDCSKPPKDHIPPSFATYAGGDAGKLRELCGLVNTMVEQNEQTVGAVPGVYFDARAPTSAVVQPLHDALAPLLTDPPPHNSAGDGVPGWVKVAAGAIGGCAIGGIAGLVVAGPAGAAVGCVVGGAAGAGAVLLASKLNCSLTDISCLFKGLTGWAARGMVAALKLGLGALSGGAVTGDLFASDVFDRLWIAVALLSTPVLLLYGLLSIAASIAFLRPGRMLHALTGIAAWTIGLNMAIPMTALLITAADQAADYICTWGGNTFIGMGQRFQASIVSILNGGPFGDIADSLLGFGLALLGTLGGLWLLGFAITRAIGMLLAVIGLPLALAATAGPAAVRKAPVRAISVIITLALFKIPAALGLTLACGLIGGGKTLLDLAVAIGALLLVCFSGHKLTSLVGGGLDLASGDQAHHQVRSGLVGGAAAAATAVAVFGRMSRHGSTLLEHPRAAAGRGLSAGWGTATSAAGAGRAALAGVGSRSGSISYPTSTPRAALTTDVPDMPAQPPRPQTVPLTKPAGPPPNGPGGGGSGAGPDVDGLHHATRLPDLDQTPAPALQAGRTAQGQRATPPPAPRNTPTGDGSNA